MKILDRFALAAGPSVAALILVTVPAKSEGCNVTPSINYPGCSVYSDAYGRQYGFQASDGTVASMMVTNACDPARRYPHTYRATCDAARHLVVSHGDKATKCYDTSAGAMVLIPEIECPSGQAGKARHR